MYLYMVTPSVVVGDKMSLMLYVIIILLVNLLIVPTVIGESSSQHDLADVCNSLSDIRVDNTKIFAPVATNDSSADSDADVYDVFLMLHVFVNSLAAQEGIIRSVDEWITYQHSANTSSLLNTWIRSTRMAGVNISDIRFRVYLPSSSHSQDQRNLKNLTNLYSHLQNTTILNESEWKKLGHDTIYYNSTGVDCKSNYSIWFDGTQPFTLPPILIADTNCPDDDIFESCLNNHWNRLCGYGLRQGDIFEFKFMPLLDGNITVSLYHDSILTITQPRKVYESLNNDHGNFTLPEDGGYYIIIENADQESAAKGYFYYSITYDCTNVTSYIYNWLNADILNQQEINVVLNDIRVKPVLHGQYEYITQSPFKVPGIVLLVKSYFRGIVEELEYMPVWIAKAFGAAIQNEDRDASCKQIQGRMVNDTVTALHQPEKLRCWLFNSLKPFGNNFNRTLIEVRTNDGNVSELYIPSSKASRSNHSILYCNEQKFCEWTITPSNATLFHTKLVTTNSISPTSPIHHNLPCSTESCGGSNTNTVATSVAKLMPSPILPYYRPWLKPPTEMKIIFGFHDTISLNYQDIEEWVLYYAHRSITDLCIQTTIIMLTIDIEDANQLNWDIVSLQYQLRNNQLYLKGHLVCIMHIVSNYDCDSTVKEENFGCPKRHHGLKTWHIISFSFSGVIGIIDVALGVYLWHRCRLLGYLEKASNS